MSIYSELTRLGMKDEEASKLASSTIKFDLKDEIHELRTEMKVEFANIHGELKWTKWIMTTNAALTAAILIRLLMP